MLSNRIKKVLPPTWDSRTVNMSSISVISRSKVAPVPLKNNFVSNELKIINQSKYVIIIEAILGINRLYLLQYNNIILKISVLYSFVALAVVVVVLRDYKLETATTTSIKYTKHTEFILFILIALFSSKERNKILFQNLSNFDEMMKIQNDLNITSSARYAMFWTLASIMLNMGDTSFRLITKSVTDWTSLACIFVINMSHDMEHVFFFTLLRCIYFRLLILKSHVAKVFDKTACNKLSTVEKLCEKTRFDVSSLHRVYELLHKCSEQLNSTMNIPMLILFSTSAVISIMMLKKLITGVQNAGTDVDLKLAVISEVFHCLKYTILVVIPCYYSSVTAGQTTILRTMLHDAINNNPMNKAERRRVKTFYHLTRESDFGYAICGVIKLNMSLPLSYISLCTTYLVIVIQFSKFID